MLERLCQLKSLLFVMLISGAGCSFFQSDRDTPASELLSNIPATWFAKNPKHALLDQEGKLEPHHFFDVKPDWNKSFTSVNVVVITPAQSPFGYQLDLASGQRYYSHSYCAQKDIWAQASGRISRPSYTTAIIPRQLDQIGEAQKVIVFGGEEKFNKLKDFHQHRVRVVGSFIEQLCPEGNCLGKNNWISRMVFVGVDPDDKSYGTVMDLQTLENKVDWKKAKAELENLDGINGTTKAYFPAVRVGQLIRLDEANQYLRKNSIFMSEAETDKIQSGCQALYEKLWTDVGEERAEDRPALTVAELNTKLKLLADLKKQKKPGGFAARFKVFTKKYYPEFATCQKFVYLGNVNTEPDKFWFYQYVSTFYRLHKEGYFFDCAQKTWQKNIMNSDGHTVHDLTRDVEECSVRDLDYAMDYMSNYLNSIKMTEGTYYKFLDYDNHVFGTHHKVYSWVKMKSKSFDCSSDPNLSIRKDLKVFPEEVSWKKRKVEDIEDEMKIIY